jgi:O-antigen/teichoic acid export membrane protein
MTAPSTPLPSLRARMLGATQWVVLASSFSHVLRLVSNLILTRLLVPEMFGLMAIATTITVIVAMLSDIGLRQAVVQSPRGDEEVFLNTSWSVQVAQGFIWWIGSVLIGLGLYLAVRWGWLDPKSTYGHPLLPWLIAGTGFISVISAFSSTLAITAIRNFQLRIIVMLDLTGQLSGLFVMILLAWWTKSIWALVVGTMVATGVSAVLSHVWKKDPKNRMEWDKSSLQELFSYGKWLALSSAVTVFASNGDRLMLAAYANTITLGLYSVALSLVSALDTILMQLFEKVMLPAFSEVARKNPNDVPQAYFKLRWRIDPIILASSGLLFGGAQMLVEILYDKRYANAGEMLQILALGIIVTRYKLVQQVYFAIAQTRYFVPLNMVRLIATFTLIPLGYYLYDFKGTLIGIALRDVPSAILTLFFNTRHGLNSARLEFGTLIFWPLGYAAAQSMVWILSVFQK